MKEIYIQGAEKPAGHYAPAVASQGLLHISGQLPVDPFTGAQCHGSAAEQTARALENVALILQSAGSSLDRVVKDCVYVSDIGLWDEVNAVYAGFFGACRPARVVVPTGALHHGFLVEIAAEAEL